jgi:alpha-glucosidase
MYIYQGDELGLPEVEDIPADQLQDPMYFRSHGIDPGRDGCRVPIPWSGDHSPYGFSADDSVAPWLPQPADWAARAVAAQEADEDSMLSLYRRGLRLRRGIDALGDGAMNWAPAPEGVLAFHRERDFACVVNLSSAPVDLPEHDEVLIASEPLADGRLPSDTTVWLRLPHG